MDQTELRYVVSLALIMMFFFRPSSSSTSTVATSTSSTSRLTDKPDNIEDCDEVVLIDSKFTPLQTSSHNLTDYINCPAYKTPGHCMITFKGKSALLRETFKLCATGSLLVTPISQLKVTIRSSSEKTWKDTNDFDHNTVICAQPNEELQVIYEWTKICLSGMTGNMYIKQIPVVGTSAINLVTSEPCDVHRYLFSRITVVSSYEPGWSEKLNFCEARLDLTFSGKFCFKFSHFTAYLGGASLHIKTEEKRLIFSYRNPIPKSRKVCIPVQFFDDIYINVVPGKGSTTKFHHAFLLSVYHVEDNDHEEDLLSDNDYEEEENHDKSNSFPQWWIFLLLASCFLFGFACCYFSCCRGKKAPYRFETPNRHSSDEPTDSASRYSAARPLFPQSTVPSVQQNSRHSSTEQHMMTLMEPPVRRMEPAAEPDSEKPPSYDSLFPENKYVR